MRFDCRKAGSQILNPLGVDIAWTVFDMNDEHGLKPLLADCKAKLARAELAVKKADEKFEELKTTRANEGRSIPEERDRASEADYWDALAAADVAGEEVDKLENMLA